MKTRILTLSIMLSVIFGCSKSTQLPSLEIHPNGDKTTIEQKLEGVSLKFCILNQYGEPATVFNKGENFTFNFSIYNHEKDTTKISTDFINDDFYRVFNTSENSDMGKSWTGVWCNYSLQPQEIKVPPSQNRE
ncbi:MAG: hypothetical protein KAG37_07395, partial [Flavobacteriales bacterium]|nr:hypothetical protein [Flavobacteriales bacterium]